MIFNMWKKFPKHKPKEERWYACTIEVPHQQRYVLNLFWEDGKFMDHHRQWVFDAYKVYNGADTYNTFRLKSCELCDRTDDVVYWKKIPKPNMKGFVEYK